MPELSPAAERRAILLLALAAFVSASAFRICDPTLPMLAAEFGTTTGQAAHAVTAFAVAYGVLQMFFGPVGDRYGKYRVVCTATFLWRWAAPARRWPVRSTRWWPAARCRRRRARASCRCRWPGSATRLPYERRQATLARFLTGTVLGMAAGQLAGGIYADTLGWRAAFATLVLGYLVVGALLLREVRSQTARGFGGGAGGARVSFVAQTRQVLGVPWARVVIGTVFFEGLLTFGALAFAPSYLHERFGLSLTAAGALVSACAPAGG